MVTKNHLQNLYARLSRVSVKLASKPMELSLIRDIFAPQRTLGVLYVDGIKECYICEDMVRPKGEKIYGQTAIPEGRYEIKITMSNRFKRELPILLNVPNFEGIRIHSGNHEGHTEGCLLPGKTRNASGVFSSVIATNNLILKIRTALQSGRRVFITIKNEPNA
jgi:hypothetical protein